MKRTFLALALCLSTLPAHAFTARVVAITDGDTVGVVTPDNRFVKVRLANLDAPEKAQPFGQRAKRALSDLIFNKTVEIDDRGHDRYGRTIGLIHAPFDVSEEMVRKGMAWCYVRYNTDPAMPGIEQQARAGRLGLWLQPDATPPWEWRHSRAGR